MNVTKKDSPASVYPVKLKKVSVVDFKCTYNLMRGRIKGPRPLVNPMQSDKTHVIKILHGNSTPKATNL